MVQASPQFGFHLPELCPDPPAHRPPQHRVPPLPGLPATVREAEEVEGPGLRSAPVAPLPIRLAAEREKARLLRVQSEAEPREPLVQLSEEPFRLVAMLEAHHEVVREAHRHNLAARFLPPPAVDPE